VPDTALNVVVTVGPYLQPVVVPASNPASATKSLLTPSTKSFSIITPPLVCVNTIAPSVFIEAVV
jgi:hypothetical protein